MEALRQSAAMTAKAESRQRKAAQVEIRAVQAQTAKMPRAAAEGGLTMALETYRKKRDFTADAGAAGRAGAQRPATASSSRSTPPGGCTTISGSRWTAC